MQLAFPSRALNTGPTAIRGLPTATFNDHLIFHLTTDQDGRIEIPAVCNPTGKMRVIVAGEAVHDAFVEPSVRRMTPYRALSLHALQAPGKEHKIDLGAFATVQLRLLDESGIPAPDAQIMLISRAKKDDYDCGDWNTIATPDSAGRLTLQLQPGRWAVFSCNGHSTAQVKLKLKDRETKSVEVRMKPMPVMLGRAVDSDGKPIADASLDCHSSTWHSSNNDDPIQQRIAQSMNWQWIDRTKTDQDGNFACRFLDMPTMTYEARLRAGDKKSGDFKIIAGEDRVTITLK